jgi:hypothetical protein
MQSLYAPGRTRERYRIRKMARRPPPGGR